MKTLALARFAVALATMSSLAGCSPRQESGDVDLVNMSAVKADLQAVSKARILLGHQSVGRNLLAGLEALAAEAGVPLRIESINGVPPDSAPGLFHSEIGTNGDPAGKCEIFSSLLIRPERPLYDLAMMKFCYVDLQQGTPLDAASMLDRYSALVDAIKRQRPDIRLVHITLPLRADPPGKKQMLMRLLGRSTDDADNALRNAFNDGIRQRFRSEPLFDLAMVESTLPDGSRSMFSRDGRSVYTLAREYTDDGGHLNELGRRRAAIAFVRTLASALQAGAEEV